MKVRANFTPYKTFTRAKLSLRAKVTIGEKRNPSPFFSVENMMIRSDLGPKWCSRNWVPLSRVVINDRVSNDRLSKPTLLCLTVCQYNSLTCYTKMFCWKLDLCCQTYYKTSDHTRLSIYKFYQFVLSCFDH